MQLQTYMVYASTGSCLFYAAGEFLASSGGMFERDRLSWKHWWCILWPSDFIWKGSHDDQSFSDLKLLFVCGKHLPVIILSNQVCYVECKLWQWLLAKQRMCIKLCLELGSLCRETEFYPLKIFTKFSAFILVKYHFSSSSCVLAYFIIIKQVKHFVSICKSVILLSFARLPVC